MIPSREKYSTLASGTFIRHVETLSYSLRIYVCYYYVHVAVSLITYKYYVFVERMEDASKLTTTTMFLLLLNLTSADHTRSLAYVSCIIIVVRATGDDDDGGGIMPHNKEDCCCSCCASVHAPFLQNKAKREVSYRTSFEWRPPPATPAAAP